MIKTTLLVIVAAIAALLLYAATRPDAFRVERSTLIAAPPAKVYGLIVDLHGFNTWNPFSKKDPTTKGSYSGPASGPGAAYAWDGEKTGQGSMQIVEAAAPTKVAMKLDFIKPFEAHNRADFSLVPEGGATRVTWAMHGPLPYLAKVMHVFINMDRMVGSDFEAGLADLKTLAEKP